MRNRLLVKVSVLKALLMAAEKTMKKIEILHKDDSFL